MMESSERNVTLVIWFLTGYNKYETVSKVFLTFSLSFEMETVRPKKKFDYLLFGEYLKKH